MSPANRAALLAVAGDGVLTLMDSIIKSMAMAYPATQVAFLRFLLGGLVAGAVFAVLRPGLPSLEAVRAHAVRAVVVVVTATTFFFALGRLPLAEAIALSFLSPIFMVVLGVGILGERAGPRVWIAITAGIVGMLVISWPHLGTAQRDERAVAGIVAVLVSALSYALVTIQLRARATRDPAVTIVLFQNAGPALLLAPMAALAWTPLEPSHLATFGVVAVLGVTGHMLLAKAFSLADAVRLAPLHYTVLVWAIAFGALMHREVPSWTMLAGAAIIVAGTWLARSDRA